MGVAVQGDTLWAIGGFTEQNRKPHAECFAWSSREDKWRRIAPLPAACGSVACVVIGGKLHGIGGAVGDTFDTKKSVDWHLVYDPAADRWQRAAPLPTARDHVGAVVANGLVHVIGGRVDSFNTNSNLHHVYDPRTDKWAARNPLPTARSGHGACLVQGRIFIMGGEGTNRGLRPERGLRDRRRQLEAVRPHAHGAARAGRGGHRQHHLCGRGRRHRRRQHPERRARGFCRRLSHRLSASVGGVLQPFLGGGGLLFPWFCTTSPIVIPAVRKLWLALAYAVAMVAGTMLLIAAFSGQGDPVTVGGTTRAEVLMQSAAERALVSPQAAVLAGSTSNERRGI